VQRHAAAERVANDVRHVQAQVPDERGNVAGHEVRAERSVDVGGPTMSLEVDQDHLVTGREHRQDRREHLAGAKPAVQQDERSPAAVSLVVQVQAG